MTKHTPHTQIGAKRDNRSPSPRGGADVRDAEARLARN